MRRRSSSCSVRNWWRSSRAENSSSASGFTRPSCGERTLGGAAAASCCSSRTNGTGSPSCGTPRRRRPAPAPAGAGRSRRRATQVEPELLERALLELVEPHALLGAGHLVAVHAADQLAPAPGRARAAARGPASMLAPRGARRPPRRASRAAVAAERPLQPVEDHRHALQRRRGRRGPRGAPVRGGRSHGPVRRALARRRAPASPRDQPGHGRAPRRSAARAAPRSRRARAARAASASLASVVDSARRPRRPAAGQRAARARRAPARSASRASSAVAMALGQPFGLTLRRPRLGAVLGELLGDRSEVGVGLVQPGQRRRPRCAGPRDAPARDGSARRRAVARCG